MLPPPNSHSRQCLDLLSGIQPGIILSLATFPYTHPESQLDGSLRTISTCMLLGFLLHFRSAVPTTCSLLEFQIQHGKRPNSLHNPLWELSQLYFLLRESHVFIQQILVYSTTICACYGPGTGYMVNGADMGTPDTCLKPHGFLQSLSHPQPRPPSWRLSHSEQRLQGHLWFFLLTHHRNPSLL